MVQINEMNLGKVLSGRVAIVTGAASGIGQSIAAAFARVGASVVVADVADSKETLALIGDAGGRASAIACDISVEADVARMVEHAEKTYGGLDILVNNAAIFPLAPAEQTTLEVFSRVMAVNAAGTFLCCKAAIPAMRRRGRGKIINISSGTFFEGFPTGAAYVASKGAVIGLSRVLARELGSANIQVNVITPGLIRTKGAVGNGMTDEAFQFVVTTRQSVGRVGLPGDFDGVAVFLASDMSNFMTGQILNNDGGVHAH
jgi:3-oxoacyl-[acyl-carrier protein] reductase